MMSVVNRLAGGLSRGSMGVRGRPVAPLWFGFEPVGTISRRGGLPVQRPEPEYRPGQQPDQYPWPLSSPEVAGQPDGRDAQAKADSVHDGKRRANAMLWRIAEASAENCGESAASARPQRKSSASSSIGGAPSIANSG